MGCVSNLQVCQRELVGDSGVSGGVGVRVREDAVVGGLGWMRVGSAARSILIGSVRVLIVSRLVAVQRGPTVSGATGHR